MFLGVGLGLPCTVMEIFCFGGKVGVNGEGAFGDVERVSFANKKSYSKTLTWCWKRRPTYGAVEIWMNKRVRIAVPFYVRLS
ncbi:hypothetical protein ACFXTH_033316 [Malus domestica]